MKKRILAVFVALLLIVSTVSFAFAKEEVVPVIVVPGYSASDLFLDYGTENQKHVWGFDVSEVLQKVEKKLGKLGLSLLKVGVGDTDTLIDVVGEVLEDVAGVLACNDDGTSKYNVTAGLNDPALTTTAALNETYGEGNSYIQLPKINNYFCDEVGAENVFNCHVDFRMSAMSCALELDSYVKAVKEYTGASKVKIFGLSHGGMTVGTYLSMLAEYPEMMQTSLDDIDRAVLFHPALAGAAFLEPVMDDNVELSLAYITEYMEVGELSEYDLEVITHLFDTGIINKLANGVIPPLMQKVMGNWGSIWDFLAPDVYDHYKEMYLDETENAGLIEKSDFMHYNIMTNYADAFKAAQDAGVKINIIAGYGKKSVTGGDRNCDAVLSVTSTTGAKTGLLGQRFVDGYTGTGSNCTDPTHNHVSPTMEVDATYAYLPENTFYVYDQFHGQAWFDDYTMNLCLMLLFDDSITDIYSSPTYTQFEYSRNGKDEISVKFNGSASTGYVTADSNGIYITNLSKKYPVVLNTIYCKGMDLTFDTKSNRKIKIGETVFIPFSGEIPDVNMVRDTLVVNYTQLGAASCVGLREIPICITGGKEVGYNADDIFTDFDLTDPAAAELNSTALGRILAKSSFSSYILNFINNLKLIFSRICSIFSK